MQVWSWLVKVYLYEERLFTVLAAAAGLIALAALVGYFLKSTGAFAALSTVIGGAARVFIIGGRVDERAGFVGASCLLIFSGAVYLLLFAILVARKGILERKRRRAEIARRLCYTLPERENTYIRTRLSTVLQIPKETLNEYMGTPESLEQPVKLEHARQLLSKVREAPLSQAERLQTEEMGKALSLYLQKEGWTIADLRAVNELCASLLKLSAKYAV